MKDDLNQIYIMSKFNPCSVLLMGSATEPMVKIIKKPLESELLGIIDR